MRVSGRLIAVVLSAVLGVVAAGPARAQVTSSTATNTQAGNNHQTTNQGGSDASGDAIGGQVNGVVANGRTSVDAKNTSSNSSVESGDAFGSNSANSFTGLNAEPDGGVASNFQDGNNRTTVNQTADATSGDGVSGQVIGAVTQAGGSASIVAANTSDNNDVQSGDSIFFNTSDSFVGLNATPTADGLFPTLATAVNIQDGNNSLSVDQTASSATGNAVAGQILGVVSAGTTSVDATNTSTNNDVDTVFTESDNTSLAFVGLDANPVATGGTATAAATNVQDGSNRARISQFAPGTANSANAFVGLDADPTAAGPTSTAIATNTQDGVNSFNLNQTAPTSSASVDSVAGQVVGAVTSAGGSASYVAANLSDNNSVENVGIAGQIIGGVSAGTTSVDASNSSTNNDVVGGVTAGSNDATAFVGENADALAGSLAAATSTNTQDGANRFTASQSASTGSGYPIAGQIIGVVTTAGGSASIVGANVSNDNSVETGDATAPNSILAFVGLDAESLTDGADASATNTQDGTNRFTADQTASATSGAGIAGQVLGVVSAGATSVDAKNNSTGNDVETGEALATNSVEAQVGLLAAALGETGANVQDGSNRKLESQSAEATSGDAIAAQVTGVVTGAGGSASVVVDNTSTNLDVTAGEATFDNTDDAFVGLSFTPSFLID